MTSERGGGAEDLRPGGDFERVDRLLEEALELPPEEREEWLENACGGDESLRARVGELLELSHREDDLLTPGGGLAGPVADALEKTLERQLERPLEPGSRLGPFEVRELLGVGGMGRVYLAHDPKLARNVAIKALSGGLSSDPSALRRFEREARVLATLSHPNIASIYDLEVLEGSPFLILEYVEGETLDEMLQRQLPRTGQVIDISLQILAALEEAHSKGIVHRDLKPSNVKIDRAGRVKVLDFGLARRIDVRGPGERGSGSVTGSGLVLGTAPYMSPEQARGDEVDARTDIWSFGCLLFELLTGRRAFQGRTVSDLLASVLRDPVDIDSLPPRTPEELHRILRRCLQKDPQRRFQHVGDIRVELAELRERREPVSASRRPVSGASRTTANPLPWAIAAAAVVALVGVLLWRSSAAPGAAGGIGVQQFVLGPPPGLELPSGDYAPPMTLAPDGGAVALMAASGEEVNLYYRTLERLEWIRLPGTRGAWQPFFSSDGRDIGFFASGRLQRVALDGTQPTSLAQVGANPRGATWTGDGRIVFGASQTSALSIVDARGGTPTPFTQLDEGAGERSHRWPQALPGGEWVLFTIDYRETTFDDAALAIASLETRERRTVLRGGSHGRYLPSGHLLFARQGSLHAVPFDLASGRVTGTPRVVLEGVAYDLRNGGSKFAVADDGSLAYVPDPLQSDEHRLVWRGVDGRREVITEESRRYHDPALDPAGRRVALRVGDPMSSDVWTLDLASGTLAQVTFGLRAFRP
ncbi:MAG: serine/threonine protein kinase, partial [Acidobacteria bacterium]|nr:serine/threonine protein kinase [Acidobacteriota bacterium]